jgi:hypothetical protein
MRFAVDSLVIKIKEWKPIGYYENVAFQVKSIPL